MEKNTIWHKIKGTFYRKNSNVEKVWGERYHIGHEVSI